MLNIILFGPPGAGKGTQSEKLIEKYRLKHIATGDLFRKHLGEGTPLGKLAQRYMDEGKLVPDEVVIGMVDETIKENEGARGFIFDGFPRTVAQAAALDHLLEEKGTPITGMVALDVPEDELIERIKNRGKTSGRADDQQESKILTRIQVYKNETLPVANYYNKKRRYAQISGVGEIEEIFDQICEKIDQLNSKG